MAMRSSWAPPPRRSRPRMRTPPPVFVAPAAEHDARVATGALQQHGQRDRLRQAAGAEHAPSPLHRDGRGARVERRRPALTIRGEALQRRAGAAMAQEQGGRDEGSEGPDLKAHGADRSHGAEVRGG